MDFWWIHGIYLLIYGLVQERRNSSALAMELCLLALARQEG